MGKELQMARKEEEGQSVLLASTSNREPSTASSIRNQRAQESNALTGYDGRAIKGAQAKSKSSRKTKGTNASPTKRKGRRRDNQDRKSNRRDEGKDEPVRRTAQELGVVFPGSHCDELGTVPHHWIESSKFDGGTLYQCRFCRKYIWLGLGFQDAVNLGKLMRQHGKDEGYCHFLNKHRPAKMLVAKLQYLGSIENTIVDSREFARFTDGILSDKDYDRKEKEDGVT